MGTPKSNYIQDEGLMMQNQLTMNWDALFQQYRRFIGKVWEHRNEEGISHVTVRDLSRELSLSPADISTYMKKCIELGMIQVMEPSGYFVPDVEGVHTPIYYMSQLLQAIQHYPESSFEQQAQQLGCSLKELEAVYSYFIALLL